MFTPSLLPNRPSVSMARFQHHRRFTPKLKFITFNFRNVESNPTQELGRPSQHGLQSTNPTRLAFSSAVCNTTHTSAHLPQHTSAEPELEPSRCTGCCIRSSTLRPPFCLPRRRVEDNSQLERSDQTGHELAKMGWCGGVSSSWR